MFPRCKPNDNTEETRELVDSYSSQGLRTLVLARKEITQREYSKFYNSL